MKDVVMAIDQGTTGSTVILIDEKVTIISQANFEFPNHYPKKGWVEHDVREIWNSIEKAAIKAMTEAGDVNIKAIGFP